MASASQNLTPLTLELGGKSPALIAPEYNLKEAANRICFGKSFNAGQTCISPDYVLLEKETTNSFIRHYKDAFNSFFPDYENNQDYTALINDRQHQRMQHLINDALQKGATVHCISHDETERFKMAPRIITDVKDNMLIAQEEIFGPILPIITYENLGEAQQHIQKGSRPLALYLFSNKKTTQRHFENFSHSGGLCINDTLMHIAVDDMPFGGVGDSGMGHYHGHEGFLNFSKSKSVFYKSHTGTSKLLNPPYNPILIRILYRLLT